MIIALTGVLLDGSLDGAGRKLEPYRQDLEVPRGEDVRIHLTVVRQSGAAADLTGLQGIALTLQKFELDAVPLLVVAADPVNLASGMLDLVVDSAGTFGLIEMFLYRYDIVLTDKDGLHWQLLPVSRWLVTSIVAQP